MKFISELSFEKAKDHVQSMIADTYKYDLNEVCIVTKVLVEAMRTLYAHCDAHPPAIIVADTLAALQSFHYHNLDKEVNMCVCATLCTVGSEESIKEIIESHGMQVAIIGQVFDKSGEMPNTEPSSN